MTPSAQICRAQEQYQRDASLTAPLANVREIAALAAVAWASEACAADQREARRLAQRLANSGERTIVPACFGNDLLSENPDRDCADI